VREYWTSTAPSAEGGSFGDVGLAGAKTVIAALAPGHLAAIAGRAMDLPRTFFTSPVRSVASSQNNLGDAKQTEEVDGACDPNLSTHIASSVQAQAAAFDRFSVRSLRPAFVTILTLSTTIQTGKKMR
jgi:hypothetical protein